MLALRFRAFYQFLVGGSLTTPLRISPLVVSRPLNQPWKEEHE